MNKDLNIDNIALLLDELKRSMRTFVEDVRNLARNMHLLNRKEKASIQTDCELVDDALAVKSAVIESSLEEQERLVTVKGERRHARIANIAQRCKKEALDRIEREEEQRVFLLDNQIKKEEAEYPLRLQQADETFKLMRRRLGEQRKELDRLNQLVHEVSSGYGSGSNMVAAELNLDEIETAGDVQTKLDALDTYLHNTEETVEALRKHWWARYFRVFPFSLNVILILALCGGLVPLGLHYQLGQMAFILPACLALVPCLLLTLIYTLSARRTRPLRDDLAVKLEKARQSYNQCLTTTKTWHETERETIQVLHEQAQQETKDNWKNGSREAGARRQACARAFREKEARMLKRNERLTQLKIKRLALERKNRIAELQDMIDAEKEQVEQNYEAIVKQRAKAYRLDLHRMAAQFQAAVAPCFARITTARETVNQAFPPWDHAFWQDWSPPVNMPSGIKIGSLHVNLTEFAQIETEPLPLPWPWPETQTLPVSLTFPQAMTLLLETKLNGRDEAITLLNTSVLRLLGTAPPGRLNLTIIDPVGLGQNFAGIMHLADYEETLINSRIWTDPRQIEQRLADVNEHMEKIFQMYLRNEYANLSEYNRQAGDMAEKYHFVVIADFPAGFSETAAKRLLSILTSGATCGVYALMHWDCRRALPSDCDAAELCRHGVHLLFNGETFVFDNIPSTGTRLVMDPAPDAECVSTFLQKVGIASIDANRVEVPFSYIAPSHEEVWTETTENALRLPVGRAGATRLQYFELGQGMRQHVLVAGKTGSGKSTLFHVLIANTALRYSPDQAEFYLIDFKKGVEFKCYARQRVPHVRVVAIESDRDFGLSVLQRVDVILQQRGDLFRKTGVQDLAGFKATGDVRPMPRIMLLIDEFQEFFVEDDQVAQKAALLLDRLVRQGRAFGIHVILGSQTLGGAYTLSRSTLGQMAVRIALQCNEADAYLIMDDDNAAPRLLSRPGEALYNDAAGRLEGNSPFQVAWFGDRERDACLTHVRALSDRRGRDDPDPIVFEGNAPALVRENPLLRKTLAAGNGVLGEPERIWLGASNSIKGPTEIVFHRQSGCNTLCVGQNEEAMLSLLGIGLVSLAAQRAPGEARFIVLDNTPAQTRQRIFLEGVVNVLPHSVELLNARTMAERFQQLNQEIEQRAESGTADREPATFIFIHQLQRYKQLRYEDDFMLGLDDDDDAKLNPGKLLNEILRNGADQGFHLIVSCDTADNATSFFNRKTMNEFAIRVLFQMSANDSAALIDSPEASRLGLYRAILYNQQEACFEIFRPYELPDTTWLEEVGAALRAKA